MSEENSTETQQPGPKPQRKKPGPKPGAKRTRSNQTMNATEAGVLGAHRGEQESDHGKLQPMRDRIPVMQARHLDNVEGLIPDNAKGRWIMTKEFDKYVQGGYHPVKDRKSGDPITRVSGETKLHLMMIHIDDWTHDQKLKRDKNIAVMGDSVKIDKSKEYTDNQSGSSVQGTVSDDPFLS